MMEIVITNNMRNKAHKKAKEMGVLYMSITRGKGIVFGFLGEEIARKVLGGEENNTRDYDLIVSNKKIDVKTKKTSVAPKLNYECSVADLTKKQECDYFAFVRVLDDQSKGWFLCVKDRDKYYEEATYLTKGQHDPSNNFTVRANCYNLPISSLSFNEEGIIHNGSKVKV